MKFLRAQKARPCELCHNTIDVGEKYSYWPTGRAHAECAMNGELPVVRPLPLHRVDTPNAHRYYPVFR